MSSQVPGPAGLPLVGSIPAMIVAGGLIQYFEQLWHELGDSFRVRLGRRDMWIFAHPDHAEHILKRARQNYIKGESFDQMRLLVGDGLLTDDSDDWLRRRRLAAPAFHRTSLVRLIEMMDRAVSRSLARMRRRHPEGGVIDVHPEMTRLTLEIVSDALFGVGITERADASGAAFSDALDRISRRGNAPVAIPLGIPTPGNLRLRRSLSFVDRIVHEVIDQAEARLRERPRELHDGELPTLLGMLLAAKDPDGGPGLTRAELRDEVMTMYLAGHETTALNMSWACHLLARRPRAWARLREEARSLPEERPSFEEVSQLGFARMVIDEVLRLRPPVWGTGRTAVADDEIAGVRVPAGATVVPNFYLIHRHRDFWDEPERFEPERFEPGGEARHPFAYLPFGGGPRICIGQGFALIESQLILARLAEALDIEAAGELGVNAGASLRPDGPVRVRLRWRAPARDATTR